jgi:hypothetical protein
MAIEMHEISTSRKVTGTTEERLYILMGSDDREDILEYMIANSPSTGIYSIPRIYLRCFVEPIFTDSAGATGVWQGTVWYEAPESSPLGEGTGDDARATFEISGGSQHITQSLATLAGYGPDGETIPDLDGAINVQDGNVLGCDILAPEFNFTLSKVYANGDITNTFIATIAGLVATTNDATFLGFAAGEVLLTGAQGERRSDGSWRITYTFAVSYNTVDIPIGAFINVDEKGGWEFLHVLYSEKLPDPAATQYVEIRWPVAAYVERVYYSGDFDDLAL